MKKIVIKTPAKINLTLDVTGANGGFHQLKTLVASIDVYDKITLKARRDKKIKLSCRGIKVGCKNKDNNAYKAAELFVKEFGTCGANIKIKKGIPVGAGLGGSSADIAGVLVGMKKLYPADGDLLPLANALGSDSGYMLSGGFAVLEGRGDVISKKKVDVPLYLIIITEKQGVSAGKVYAEFDKMNLIPTPCTAAALNALAQKDFEKFVVIAKNDLYAPSKKFVPQMENNVYALKKAGAPLAIMTGSGSAVIGVFNKERERDKSYEKLRALYGKSVFTAKTVDGVNI